VSRAATLVAALLLVACAGAGGVQRSELPASPVALLQRSEEQALRRLDALRDYEKRQEASQREGIVLLENLDGMLGGSPELERRLQHVQGHLALLDPRTGETERIENAPPQARPTAWSPDRRRLLVSGTWRQRRQLFAWDRETRRIEIVTAGPAHHVNGCWTGDGRLVAVEVEREELANATSRLVASAPGGGALSPIGPEAFHMGLACSPTVAEIAFVRIDPEQGRPHLYVQSLDPPGEPREVAIGASPVFAPDGEWIVYVAPTTRGQRLFRVRRDGSGRTALGAGTTDENFPAVAPDGRYVAFVATDENDRERVWVRRMDGTGDRPLLSTGDGSVPVW
jgi:dipeptidyl aminopeptidase/acylaminoacyl peptidase